MGKKSIAYRIEIIQGLIDIPTYQKPFGYRFLGPCERQSGYGIIPYFLACGQIRGRCTHPIAYAIHQKFLVVGLQDGEHLCNTQIL